MDPILTYLSHSVAFILGWLFCWLVIKSRTKQRQEKSHAEFEALASKVLYGDRRERITSSPNVARMFRGTPPHHLQQRQRRG